MFKKRRDVSNWGPSQLVDQVKLCLASSPGKLDVRSAIVLHQDPALLPRNSVTPDLATYVTFCLSFEGDDRLRLYGDGDVACLVKLVNGSMSFESAEKAARDWVGATAYEFRFHYLPGVYQSAFVRYVVGYECENDQMQFGWILPLDENDYLTERENGHLRAQDFPQRLVPTPATPEPGKVTFALIPAEVHTRLIQERGF